MFKVIEGGKSKKFKKTQPTELNIKAMGPDEIWNAIDASDKDAVTKGFMRQLGMETGEDPNDAKASDKAYEDYIKLWEAYYEANRSDTFHVCGENSKTGLS